MSIKKLSKKQLIAVIVAAVIIIVCAATGITCAVRDESPAQLAADVFKPNTEQLIGKWQGEKAATGYEFYEDGTYDSYILGASTTGTYTATGSKITLRGAVTYKYSISGDTMTLTLLDENGKKSTDDEKHIYTKVENFNFKTITELIQDFAQEAEESTDEATDEDGKSDEKEEAETETEAATDGAGLEEAADEDTPDADN